jgi:AraC-like DNA-binding protein
MQNLFKVNTRKRRVRFTYPTYFKNEALSALDNSSARNAAKSCGVPLSTLYRWRKDSSLRAGQDHPFRESGPLAGRRGAHGSREPGSSYIAPAASNRRSYYQFDRARARHSRKVLDRLTLAHQVIENRYFEHVSCDALAGVAEMSKCHFVRVYKQAFGESPYQHLIRRRVDAALSLLGVTLQPTLAIACAVGFESTSSLLKAIKKFSVSGVPELVY